MQKVITNYNLFNICLNLFPLSSKFLNMSKLALAGENSTTSPFLLTSFAFCIASSNVVTLHIGNSFFVNFNSYVTALYILFAVWPNNINAPTFSTIGFAIGV